jgi:hypothetical protein
MAMGGEGGRVAERRAGGCKEEELGEGGRLEVEED